MDEQPSFFRRPGVQTILVALIALAVYIYLMGRQGVASGVAIQDGRAYVAVGKYGGLRIVDLQDPASPREVGFFDTPGAAIKVAVVGHYAYVADGKRGVRIIDVSDSNAPYEVGAALLPDAQDVVVSGGYAYVAAGKTGLAILSVAEPALPVVMSILDTPGVAQGVALEQGYGFDAQPPGVSFVYVADGTRGIEVVDVRDPMAPGVVGSFDTPGEAHDLIVLDAYAYVADGPGGLQVIDVLTPDAPTQVGLLDPQGEILDVAVENAYAYLAGGDLGVPIADVIDPTNPQAVRLFDTRGTAQGITASDAFAYVADGKQGMMVVGVSNPRTPALAGVYEMPGEAGLPALAQGLMQLLELGSMPEAVKTTLLAVVLDVGLCGAGLMFGILFFAQFVLPVRSLSERYKAIERLLFYLSGFHGPAIFIENGEVKANPREKLRYGPGVALLDTASAAVFRTAHAFTRPAGPGVVFTGYGERLAGWVDLHRQLKFLGPRQNEVPFSPRDEAESFDAYDERQKRRYETSGLTRDGVEVVPNVIAIFQLDAQTGQGKTQFGYHPEAVWKAIAREGVKIDAASGAQDRLAWDWLPAYLAVDVWREYLRKFTIDELFAFNSGAAGQASSGERKTAFDTITEMVRERLTKDEVDELDETGQRTGRKEASKEFAQLQQRGIRMIAANIRNLRFPASVEDQLIESWKANWFERAQDEDKEAGQKQSQEAVTGEQEALKEFAEGASRPLDERLRANTEAGKSPPDLTETLELLLRGTLDQALRNPDLRGRLSAEKSALIELMQWVRK